MPDTTEAAALQLALDVEALDREQIHGGIPIDPAAGDAAKSAFYSALLARNGTPATCLPDRGVHVYSDHRGSGPCLCKTS